MKNYLLLILLFTFAPFHSSAADIYGGLGYSYGILSAESDFWNGGDDGTPSMTIGVHFERLAVELTYKPYTLNNIHTTSRGTYDIDISTLLLTVGGRYDLGDYTHVNFGLASYSVEVDYTTTAATALNSSSIEGSSLGIFIGGGVHLYLYTRDLRLTFDVNYYHRSMDFGIFGFETGIFYSFYSF